MKTHKLSSIIPESSGGQRLDLALSHLFSQFSRSRIQNWIKSGQLTVDGAVWRGRDKVQGGEAIALEYEETPEVEWQAEAMPLTLLHEDPHLLVVDKPVGMVVHPASGHQNGTLCNALLHHVKGARLLPRAGIIHRLDKDTSGLLVVAKTDEAYQALVNMMQQRDIKREYLAIVSGQIIAGGTVDEAIGRHPVDRKKQAVIPDGLSGGKHAVTHYRVAERYPAHTLLNVELETGRTHQIRVHMAHIHHPIVGDQTYGGRLRFPKASSDELKAYLRAFKRQALHARRLSFIHPVSNEPMQFESEIPEDIGHLTTILQSETEAASGSEWSDFE